MDSIVIVIHRHLTCRRDTVEWRMAHSPIARVCTQISAIIALMICITAIVSNVDAQSGTRGDTVRLDTVRIRASAGAIPEIASRPRRRGSGHFVSRTDIERQRPAYASDALRRVPGVSLRPSSGIGNVVRLRGCGPAVFMDGVQALNAELDEVVRPSDIEGIEIYSSSANLPPQYADRSGRSCGAILVWTRSR